MGGDVTQIYDQTRTQELRFDPLREDAQCLEIVRKLRLHVSMTTISGTGEDWLVYAHANPGPTMAQHSDLRRAICICAARVLKHARA